MAAGRKATGNRDGIASAPLAVPDNRPHTGPGARVSAYDLVCRSAYGLACRCCGGLAG